MEHNSPRWSESLTHSSKNSVARGSFIPTGTTGRTFSCNYFHLLSALCTRLAVDNGNCCTVQLFWCAFDVCLFVCICVFPGGGSGSAAFRGPNTRAMCCLCVLGGYACRGSAVWCEYMGSGGNWSLVLMHFLLVPIHWFQRQRLA